VLIEKPWGVTAFGAASVRAVPDLARVQVSVIRVEASPEAAFAATTSGVHAVREAVRRLGLAGTAVENSRLGLQSHWDGYGESRKFVGYKCTSSFSIETPDLDRIQQLLIDVVAAGAHHVESVEFDVRAKPELRAQARRDAVDAARRKAQLYAEAAGLQLGAVVHIEDVDPEQMRQEYRGHGGGGMGAAGEDLAPGHVVVSAGVALGFSIAHS
jgi:uncharacterized protein YggE